ncbi:unnamed protein product [Laminaria digitata]
MALCSPTNHASVLYVMYGLFDRLAPVHPYVDCCISLWSSYVRRLITLGYCVNQSSDVWRSNMLGYRIYQSEYVSAIDHSRLFHTWIGICFGDRILLLKSIVLCCGDRTLSTTA